MTLLMASLVALSQDASIKTIFDNPGRYLGERVEVQGTVTQFVPASTTTSAFYYIQGDYGNIITVQTEKTDRGQIPVIGQKYKVTGFFNLINNEYVVSEIRRESIAPPSAAAGPDTQEQTQPAPAPTPPAKDNTLLYVIIAIAGLLIILAIIMARKKQEKTVTSPPVNHSPTPETQPITPVTQSIHTTGSSEPTGGFTTIRIETAPKTMRFIPGKFTIISEEDKGMSFNIAGYPTPEGAMITIGRESVSGERSYAHIKIDDKFKTVSRKQAELLHSDRMLYIRNKSEANYTQVDGFELKPGEKRELKSGSKIRMGELELMYSV